MSRIKTNFQGQTLEKRREILLNELIYDHDLALRTLWLKLEPQRFQPRLNPSGTGFADFGEWESMPTELEFDHQGAFDHVNGRLWRYEGAESKSTVKSIFSDPSRRVTLMIPGIDDAKIQLERRFNLVSGIARDGFNTSIISVGKIYVPEMTPEARTRFEPAGDVPSLKMTFTPNVAQTHGDPGSEGDKEPDAPDLTPYTVIEVLTTTMEYQRKGLR